jgi:hypothetical protein
MPALLLVASVCATAAANEPKPGSEAFYILAPAAEHQQPAAHAMRLKIRQSEQVDGRSCVWWELTVGLRDGGSYGVRILSERPAMTSLDGVGRIERYQYRDAAGRTLEYVDTATGKALLPVIQFTNAFLPTVSRDAVYIDGVASAGAFLGHVLTRVPRMHELEPVRFDAPVVLKLRTDLLIGTQAAVRARMVKNDKGEEQLQTPAYTQSDYDRMIAAGANYFPSVPEHLEFLQAQSVFYRAQPVFPDSFYRANWVPGGMFIDEPSVRLGWSGGIPANAGGPEQVAESLRQHVSEHYTLARLKVELPRNVDVGTLDLILPHAPSWETDYWSAWYQLSAGAPGLVHEARYVKHGYGWEPEDLYGREGLEGLTFRDQVNCLNAFMRGAARAFDGYWGVSTYPEGDPSLRLPGMKQAYDMGARCLWFWTYPPMTFEVQEEITRGIVAHAADHPRDLAQANRAAKVGIAFPLGHAFNWSGTWGVQREALSPGGASYGDISAAGMWEGILCSRRGIPFDFLVDEPRIRELGYERLVIVRQNGSLQVEPPWPPARSAGALMLGWDEGELPAIAPRAPTNTDYTVRRIGSITIDGDLSDWHDVNWIEMTAESHGFPDPFTVETTLINDLDNKDWRLTHHSYMGMEYAQIDEALEQKYVLENLNGRGVVVTSIAPGSPADKAGILVGDVIIQSGEWPINWHFQMHQRHEPYNRPAHNKKPLAYKLRRSGRYRFGAPGDLAARIALAVDDRHLYLAGDVTDDTHWQQHFRGDFWKGDCLQIALDPTLERRERGFGEEDHEIGFVLQDGRAFAWRWHGRRGQPIGEMPGVDLKIVRREGRTLYEAAIPLAELAPLSPDLWPSAGFNVVVNDSEGMKQRKGRIEYRPKTMTIHKQPKGFAAMQFEPSQDASKVSAALLWQRRATEEGGGFRVVIAARSPQTRSARISAELASLDSPQTPPTRAELALPVSTDARERSLSIRTPSVPGRYDLRLRVESTEPRTAAEDHLPVYVYPPAIGR